MQRQTIPTVCAALWSIAGLLLTAGCGGPAYYPVQGTITLDDDPLPEASVTFRPESDDGSWGIANTDAQGQYTVTSDEHAGLLEGNYEVVISTYVDGNDQPDPPIPTVPERVPMRYNVHTTLKYEVKPSDNQANFDLDSDGDIYDPENE